MDYSFAQLQREIASKIQSEIDAGNPIISPDWITHAVILDHPDVEGADADFYIVASTAQVRNEVRQQINKLKPEAEAGSQQLVMPGFERLQTHYLVERDKERVAVRIDYLTDEEIEAKAQEQEAMGRACFEHALELRKYRDERRESSLMRHGVGSVAELRA